MVNIIEAGNGGKSEYCKMVVEQRKNILMDMWDISVGSMIETGIAFTITDGIVKTSNIVEGSSESISFGSIESAILNVTHGHTDKYDTFGYIHTHPRGEMYMNTTLSAGDINAFIIRTSNNPRFSSSLVLTQDGDRMVLFGITKKPDVRITGDEQDTIAKLSKRIENAESSLEVNEILGYIASEVKEFANPCSYRFNP